MRRSYRFLLFLVASLAILIAGCGDDAAEVELEPAGENCPAGGLKFTDGDAIHYFCDASAIVEEPGEHCAGGGLKVMTTEGERYLCESEELGVERLEGDDGRAHGCLHGALKLTHPGQPDAPQVICVEPEPAHEAMEQLIDLLDKTWVGHTEWDQACDAHRGDTDGLGWSTATITSLASVRSCLRSAYAIAGVATAGGRVEHDLNCALHRQLHIYNCINEVYEENKSDLDALCDSGFYHDTFYRCWIADNDSDAVEEVCGNPPPEKEGESGWQSRWEAATDLLGCDEFIWL